MKLADTFNVQGADGPDSPQGAGATVVASQGASVQAQLGFVAEAFRGVGVEALPVGVAELTAKQRDFVLGYLKTGNAAQAARLAGVNESGSYKMLKKPGVLRFLNVVAKQVAENGDQLVRRQWELSVSLHHELMQIRGTPRGERTHAMERREWQLIKLLNQTNTLLAALLNRLGVKLSGEVTTTQNINVTSVGVALEPEAITAYRAARRWDVDVRDEGGAA